MVARSARARHAARGIGLGMAATLAVLALHRTEFVQGVERKTLDLRFRLLPTVRPHDDIVHVDLDDKALEQIHRWPWPRRLLGQLVQTLHDNGARSVTLDILLPHPQPPRYVKEGETDLYDAGEAALLRPDAAPVPVLDDVELARALGADEDLFLAMHVDILDPAARAADPYHGLVESLAAVVSTRPAITRARAAAELGRPAAAVEQAMATAKERAFERRTRLLLRREPDLSRHELLVRLLKREPARSENDEVLTRVYLRERALAALERFAVPADHVDTDALPEGRPVPPLVTFARVIAHTGCVTVDPDPDGVVRRTGLLVRTEHGVFPQLALTLAAETLADEHGGRCDIFARGGRVVLACADGFRREVPVDDRGYMLVNWTAGRRDQHLSAVAAHDVWKARDALRRNADVRRVACLQIARALGGKHREDLEARFAAHDAAWSRLHAARRARQSTLLFDPARAPAPPDDLARQERRLEAALDAACRALLEEVDSFYLAGATTAPAAGDDPQLAGLLRLRRLIRRSVEADPGIARQLRRARARLRERIAGKIVLVGSAATGAADFVPTPLHKRTPGVVVHANILNTLLTGRFVTEPAPWLSGLIVLAVGAMVALAAATRGAVQSAGLLAGAMVGYALLDAAVWRLLTHWMVLIAPLAVMLLCFTVVTTYRQLTEARHKRQITNTFKQYLSPAMVDRLVEDPAHANLGGESRRISSLFSDLAGFTGLSERLGPAGTVNLLNRYLDRVGDIVQLRHGGTLSKYEGDAVFVFFGAPLPQPDHPARAIRAALDCQALLESFNPRAREEGLLPHDARLSARVGITTGEALVGNMGSTQKKAYTAIGDSVNLAARLETANKFFGTRILVNAEAWEAAGDGLIARPLGRVIVVGKTEPVAVWEPLARDDDADDALRRLAGDFARGVQRYAAGEFAEARECFLAILGRRDEPAARVYVGLCEQALAHPPAAVDFDGVITLTEK